MREYVTTLSSLQTLMRQRPLVIDGAISTTLNSKKYHDINHCELLNILAPEAVESLHMAYLSAGADIITTNTFAANSIALNSGYDIEQINIQGARTARQLCDTWSRDSGKPLFVAGSVGAIYRPNLSPQEIVNAYFTQIVGLIKGGVDLLLFETFSQSACLACALEAADKAFRATSKHIPLMVCMTASTALGHTLSGEPIQNFLSLLCGRNDLFSIGFNCTACPQDIVPHIQHLRSLTDIPISCRPGLTHHLSPQEFVSALLPIIRQRSALIIGGCCGTDTTHIRALHNYITNM